MSPWKVAAVAGLFVWAGALLVTWAAVRNAELDDLDDADDDGGWRLVACPDEWDAA